MPPSVVELEDKTRQRSIMMYCQIGTHQARLCTGPAYSRGQCLARSRSGVGRLLLV